MIKINVFNLLKFEITDFYNIRVCKEHLFILEKKVYLFLGQSKMSPPLVVKIQQNPLGPIYTIIPF